MRSLLNLRTGFIGLVVAAGVLIAIGGSQPIVASAVEPGLATALERSGVHLKPPAVGSAAPDAAALKSAIDVARAQFGPAGTAVAIPATVTVDGYHVGDEHSPLVIERRSVIAVQITGLSMRPHGRFNDPLPDKSKWNKELVVFVDRASREFLMATSVR
jgi:hypothetical protein